MQKLLKVKDEAGKIQNTKGSSSREEVNNVSKFCITLIDLDARINRHKKQRDGNKEIKQNLPKQTTTVVCRNEDGEEDRGPEGETLTR